MNLSSWYYKKEFLIFNFKCWNTFRCNGSWDTIKERYKASKQLICSCKKNIVKRDFTNIMNLFYAYVWLDKAIKLLMKNHEIRLICSIPRSEWMQQSILWIYFMPLYGWTKQWAIDRKSWNMSKLVMLHSQKWIQQHLIYIFMIVILSLWTWL